MSSANWFFAFPIDGEFLRELPELPPSFRLFHPADVHLTLAFLGACGEDGVERALSSLDEHLRSSPLGPMNISLADVVPMGSPRRYTALSALIDEGREQVAECLVALGNPLIEAAGGRREERPPKPHVTIARPARHATNADRKAGLVWAARLRLQGHRATLDRIALYTGSEAGQKRRFRIVREWRLE